MSDTPQDDEAKFNETVKRMLGTPPKPHKPVSGGDNNSLTDAGHKKKPDAPSVKKERPE